jgi:aminoglycoside phosphotransferase
VLHYAQGGEGQADFLLISALAGVHGATAEALSRPEALVRSFAAGLQSLHGQHSTALLRSAEDLGAKFDGRVAARVARVERRLRVGEVPGHAERLEAIRAHVAKPPPNVESDLVFTHGDYCRVEPQHARSLLDEALAKVLRERERKAAERHLPHPQQSGR